MDNFNQNNFSEEEILKGKIENLENDKIPTANIVIAGKTGSGKSTLINSILGQKLAVVGTGKPVTQNIEEYIGDENTPVKLWDTVGLELSSQATQNSINSIKEIIANKAASKDQFDKIHTIWYCINANSSRYEEREVEFVKSLYSLGVPFIIVLTRCYASQSEVDEFEREIKRINKDNGLEDITIVRTLAETAYFPNDDMDITIDPFGLNELVKTTICKMPEFIKRGFVAAQRVSKICKREECENIIFDYVDVAEKGFWDKFPVLNILTTDAKIDKMFVKIGKLYNATIPDVKIQKLKKDLGSIDIATGFWGLLSPIVSKKFENKLDSLFSEKKKQGFNVQEEKLEKRNRVSRILAFYGYNFLDAMENVWETSTGEELKNIDKTMERIKQILLKKFKNINKA